MSQNGLPTLGEMADSYYSARAARLAQQKIVDELKEKEAIAERVLIDYLKSQGLDGAKGHIANASIKRNDTVVIDDNGGAEGSGREAFSAYILETGDVSLLQFRPSLTRCKELWEEGIEIPGAKKVQVESISLTKVSKKA